MDEFKEFQGRDLDCCIQSACSFFDCPREKLEIEIIQDAKSGIFGIVGARKAKIRARRSHLSEKMLDFLENASHSAHNQKNSQKNRQQAFSQDKKSPPAKTAKHSQDVKTAFHPQQTSRPACEKQENKNPPAPVKQEFDTDAEDLPTAGIDKIDPEFLSKLACETVSKLARPIAGKDINVHAEVSHGRVKVNIEWEGDAGLLIGRDGQTLASLQYIASRILSHAMNAGIRIQLEIADYKSRQDDKLREKAHHLAEKARQTGRSWSTQPLSSYHRRIIHMELQNEPGIMTRSSGDGIMKKVIIMPKHPASSS